jgi:hypothetical protein
MNIQKMIFAALDAEAKGEIPTAQELMVLMDALHELSQRMPEFLWFSFTFEDVRAMIFKALESAIDNGVQP